MSRILFIINPMANGGAGVKVWDAFKKVWGEPIALADTAWTERSEHARELAAAATDRDIIAAVGGDGTVGEALRGIMERPGPKPKLAIIPCGTGNDVAQIARVDTLAAAASALRAGHTRAFDLIQVDALKDGRVQRSHASLFANTGFTSIPMMKPWMKRLLGSTAAYNLATLLQILVYRAPRMTVRVDGETHEGRVYLVVAGNAERVAGGCMRLSPGALTNDGLLNICLIPAMSPIRVIRGLFMKLPRGEHIHEPGVTYLTGREIEIQSDPPAALDLDGEAFGTTPATFTVIPRAVEIVALSETI